jgi:signal transduction histidine kinase
VLRPTLLDLNAVLSSFESMLRRVIGEDIDLRLRLAEGLAPVEADAGQIERVVMNLVVNARDAMPSGGILELRTESVELDEELLEGGGGHAVLRARLFQPSGRMRKMSGSARTTAIAISIPQRDEQTRLLPS